MATPHNQAEKGQIAKTVLMPGDPLRAKYIAETYLENPVCFNTVRNMFGYTGTYKGEQISVMGSGMGMPSMGIYSYELYNFYDVEKIIRIGSAGAYVPELNLGDVVLEESAWSESTFAHTQNGYDKDTIYPDPELNAHILEAAKRNNITVKLVKVHSSDVFYTEPNVDGYKEISAKHGCACVEMESFALLHNANVLHKKATCMLTISDSMPKKEHATAAERQTSFTDMMTVALEACLD